jgi:hypothetical protein
MKISMNEVEEFLDNLISENQKIKENIEEMKDAISELNEEKDLEEIDEDSEEDQDIEYIKNGRAYPQLSCTVSKNDKKTLDMLCVACTIKYNKLIPISKMIRALIRFGVKNKQQFIEEINILFEEGEL